MQQALPGAEAARNSRVLTRGLAAGFIAITVVLIAAFAVGSVNLHNVYATSEAVSHTYRVRAELRQLLATAVDAETGERGFIITGEDRYLEPYHRAVAAIGVSMARARTLTADNPEQQADLDRLSATADVKLQELARAIEQRRVSGLTAAQSIVATNVGKHTMDEMRTIVAHMEAREDTLLAARTTLAEQSYRLAAATRLMTTGLVFILVIALFFNTWSSGKERVRAAQTAERLRVTLASIGDAVIATDDRGRITQMNAVGEALTGWTVADATGKALDEIFVIINETSRLPVTNPVEKVLLEHIVVGLANHTVLLSRDGREIPVDDSAAPIKDADGRVTGVVLVFRDVTERRRAERERAAALEGLAERARLLNLTHDAILVRDLDDRIVYWNRGAEEIYGWTHAEVVEKVTHDVLRTGFPQPLEEIRAVLYQYGHWSGDLIHTRRDGVRIFAASRWTLDRNAEGLPVAILEINNDITQRKELEQAERKARDEAQRANRVKDEFLAVLSHELRTPLSSILGWTSVLSSGTLPPEKSRQALQAIERGARTEAQLVESLLDLSRIMSGKLYLEMGRLDLGSIVNDAVDTVRPAAETKGLTIDVLVPSAPLLIAGDPTRLQQVVWNLLSNAVKFTPAQGRVEVILEESDSHAEIRVRDNGRGIRPEFLPHVFDRFSQQEGSGAQAHVGLGLGLAIVRELVQAHGGSIQAHSSGEGQGSVFVVRLPIAGNAPSN